MDITLKVIVAPKDGTEATAGVSRPSAETINKSRNIWLDHLDWSMNHLNIQTYKQKARMKKISASPFNPSNTWWIEWYLKVRHKKTA